MSWGGAPPWVYKNEIAYHSSQASQNEREASKYREIASVQTAENQKCQKRLEMFKGEISKLESAINEMKDKKEINSKGFIKLSSILNELNEILNLV
ncbi:MAG: hypothetical protein ACRD94_01800 [Nitrosopumilaceae archaeon]